MDFFASPDEVVKLMDVYKYSSGGDKANEVTSRPRLGSDEYYAEQRRTRAESRRRYQQHLIDLLDTCEEIEPDSSSSDLANRILDHLFVWKRDDDSECVCSCHPRLPTSDLHDYGFGCVCGQTPEQRAAHWDKWQQEMEAFNDTPEMIEWHNRQQAQWDEVDAWLASHPGVVVTSRGGWAPVQWEGTVDGHSFYFRERHSNWRIELDMRPMRWNVDTKAWVDDPRSATTAGDVIASGVEDDYGSTHMDVLLHIVRTIRDHLRTAACGHEEQSGRFCAQCGTRLRDDNIGTSGRS